MPTYDYKCLDCGHMFEHFQRITEEQLTICPECNGHVKRLIGAGSTPIFKGSGFYQTDYKNISKKPTDSSSEKKSESSGTEKK
jgi:putative FmdB family regulatory protein